MRNDSRYWHSTPNKQLISETFLQQLKLQIWDSSVKLKTKFCHGFGFQFDKMIIDFFMILFVWQVVNHACFVVGPRREHSVVDQGDLLILSKVTSDSLNIGDIVVVNDQHMGLSRYVQQVTQIHTMSTGDFFVEIQYQPQGSKQLEYRWFGNKDVIGNVILKLPYVGMANAITHEYPIHVFFGVLFWIMKPWEHYLISKSFRKLCQVSIFSAVLFSQPKPVG
ncbi:uncharacterized protein LOC144436525 [Glandiceps talaboti]